MSFNYKTSFSSSKFSALLRFRFVGSISRGGTNSLLYFFFMDRVGLHFYPIFNPRTAYSLVSIVFVLGLYYFVFIKMNEYVSASLLTG